jgi:hypothetical protein
MNRKPSQNRTTALSDWLELFYLQAVLPEQNDIIPLLTFKNSATLLFALNSATCSGILLCLTILLKGATSSMVQSSLA